jgi:hypothetical protein
MSYELLRGRSDGPLLALITSRSFQNRALLERSRDRPGGFLCL